MDVSSSNNANELKDEKFIKHFNLKFTMNAYGVMTQTETPHFSMAMRLMDKSKQVADFGVAYGFTTKILLDNGFKVLANDLDERHLEKLVSDVPTDQHMNLELKPGNLLDLDFEENSFGGIIALRWLHFLKGEQIREVFKKFYKWLAPNGILVVVTSTPKSNTLFEDKDDKLTKEYMRRVRNNMEWPGEFKTKDIYPELVKNLPENMSLFMNELLIREASMAGFTILKSEYIDYDLKTNTIDRDAGIGMEASIICRKYY